jgi:hypothetical protein
MNRMLAVVAVAAGLWGCDVRAATTVAPDGPTYTERIKIDDV